MDRWVSQCPACAHPLVVTELSCDRCGTIVRGRFVPPQWMKLLPDQWEFVALFLKVRGNLREMERELGISYPTVRGRLEQILRLLGLAEGSGDKDSEGTKPADILRAVESGELSVDEAVFQLEKLSERGRDS